MSDRFHPISLEVLANWIADELETKDSIFGVPASLFFRPDPRDPFQTTVYGRRLETPLGVAAGPHSQLAQNIVVAWLCGARFIELKTVQTLDRIEVSKPCIDMQDEGYNIEWSQELRVEESYAEYLKAWVLIHALHRRLAFPGDQPGLNFNLSVGYDLTGIEQDNMQWYLDKVEDAGETLQKAVEQIVDRFPEAANIVIPSRLSDNVTLSTMHGCPPDEIGAICDYLLRQRGLHTSVKLNPTLLGPDRLRSILNDCLGFTDVSVPAKVFKQDLAYPGAISLLKKLSDAATALDLVFGVKLTNTLAVHNHRSVFDPAEETMYLSGRPLHALTVQLARKISEDVTHPLMISFSGGADSSNIPSLIRSGIKTVTVCSDLLRPGGYLRINHYLQRLRESITDSGAEDIDGFVLATAASTDQPVSDAAERNLRRYAESVLSDPAYHRDTFDRAHTKTSRPLGNFDCIEAPCTDGCDIEQRVPDYMRLVAAGRIDEAAEITRADNPLASILGRACHHPCERVCLRTHIDHPLAIREIKRYITDHEGAPELPRAQPEVPFRVAIIGAGPCGIGAATFLARTGIAVTIFEGRPASGGMVSATIPEYRAAQRAIERDLEFLRALGVEVHHNLEIGRDVSLDSLRSKPYDAIVVAVGARHGLRLGIDGDDSDGVLDGLDFLRASRICAPPDLGRRVGVIGGGDVAMDCARTACRLIDGEVTVFYRRTRAEMPAQKEELLDLLAEGGTLEELVAPSRVITADGRLIAVEMMTMRLGPPDQSGRLSPESVPGTERQIELDNLIVAIGQRPDLSLFGDAEVELNVSGYLAVDPETLETSIPGVYAGGDIIGPGPSNIVKACSDGRTIAEAIIARRRGSGAIHPAPSPWPEFDRPGLLRRRATVAPRVAIPHLAPDHRTGFAEVVQTLSPPDAEREASRCLDCDLMCSTCDSVCPNRAILTYLVKPQEIGIPVSDNEVLNTALFRVEQGPQVAVLADACNECGNCVTFCPTSGRPWKDKPRLFLNREDFNTQDNNAFMFIRVGDARGLQARFAGATHQLLEANGSLRYTSPVADVTMEPATLEVYECTVRDRTTDAPALEPDQLGTMVVLHRSFAASMPEFPLVEADPAWLVATPGEE
ncbi:MAG: putative selenate reductase subunit YgfK [Acidobacteria bacterium]|nr:putative selenate reductase subunit YgfK [Acidobacteriota bacterium]